MHLIVIEPVDELVALRRFKFILNYMAYFGYSNNKRGYTYCTHDRHNMVDISIEFDTLMIQWDENGVNMRWELPLPVIWRMPVLKVSRENIFYDDIKFLNMLAEFVDDYTET